MPNSVDCLELFHIVELVFSFDIPHSLDEHERHYTGDIGSKSLNEDDHFMIVANRGHLCLDGLVVFEEGLDLEDDALQLDIS
jgi:hypothetical protein